MESDDSPQVTIRLMPNADWYLVQITPAAWTRKVPHCEMVQVSIPANFYIEGEG